MDIEYPRPITTDLFGALPSLPPDRPPPIRLARSASDLEQRNTTSTRTCGLHELTIKVKGGGASTETSYKEAHAPIGPNDPRLCFAPKRETLELHWRIQNPQAVTEIKFEVRAADGQGPVWSKRLVFVPGGCPATGFTEFDGGVDAPQVAPTEPSGAVVRVERLDGGRLPSGYLDVRRAPYQVTATILSPSARRSPPRRWAYVDVRVASVEVEWGDVAWRANVPLGVDQTRGRDAVLAENVLLRDLRAANASPAAGLEHDVLLPSNLFAKKPDPSATELLEAQSAADSEEYEKTWGDGPRIPLAARVKVRDSTGAAVAAPEALGGARVLWDWDDDQPERWRSWRPDPEGGITKSFYDDYFSQRVERPPSSNCGFMEGGKHGAPTHAVFPSVSPNPRAPLRVTDAPGRKWAAFSAFGAGDPSVAAVVLQTSRMSGDRFRVRAWVEVFDDLDDSPVTGPDEIKGDFGVFVVQRQVDVHYAAMPGAQLGVQAPALKTALEQEFKAAADMAVRFHQAALTLPIYGAALRGAADERMSDPAQRSNYRTGHLFFDHAIDFAPASHPAAINYRPREDYERDLQAALRDNRVLMVELPPGLTEERIESGGKHGDVLWMNSIAESLRKKGVTRHFVLMHPASAGDFADNDQVTGRQTQAAGALRVFDNPSCWGHGIGEERVPTTPALDVGLQLKINGADVDVPFPQRKLGKRAVALDPGGRATVLQALRHAAQQLQRGQPLTIVIRARAGRSTRVQQRVDHLRGLLESIFEEGEVIDQNLFWLERGNWIFGAGYQFMSFRNSIPDIFAGSMVRRCAEALLGPNDRGVMVVHFEGATNVVHRKSFFTSANAQSWQEARSAGAFDGSVWVNERARGVVSFYTCDPAMPTTSPAACKDLDVVLAHEVGHALFLPHAVKVRPTSEGAGGEVPGVHVLHDNCLMNYELDSRHFCGLCSFRLRGWKWQHFRHRARAQYEYKVEVELDDVRSLFLSPENSPRGRRERLDVLGLLNRPLDHPEARDAERFAWEHARRVCPGIDAPGALDQAVKDFIVEGGALPARGAAARALVPLRTALYTRSKYFELALGGNGVDLTQHNIARHSLGSNPADADRAFYAANPALGRIPLKVRVRHREKGSLTPWDQAPLSAGVTVFLQLVPPDDLAAPNAPAPAAGPALGGTAYFAGPAAPALEQAPQMWSTEKVGGDNPAPPGDPQAGNAWHARGGRRGQATDFFSRGRASNFASLPSSGIKHAQFVQTDRDGEARVVFNPSRIAGDRYKLRVFVGPPTLEGVDGTSTDESVVDTGTLVRWKVARVSKHFIMPTNGDPPWLAGLSALTCSHDQSSTSDRGVVCGVCVKRYGAAAPVDLAAVAMQLAKAHLLLVVEPDAMAPAHVSTVKDEFVDALKALFVDVPELNSPQVAEMVSIVRQPMTDDPQPTDPPNTRAVRYSANAPLAMPATLTVRTPGGGASDALFTCDGLRWNPTNAPEGSTITYDANSGTVRVVVPDTFRPALQVVGQFDPMQGYFDVDALLADVFPANSPAIFNFALPAAYNHAATPPAAQMPVDANTNGLLRPGLARDFIDARTDGGFAKSTLLLTFARAIDDNRGFLPGLCVLQGAAFENYSLIWPSGTQEGKGMGNLVLLCKPNATADIQQVALHEICHTLMLQHAPTANGAKPNLHDANDVCAMSYDAHDGDLCGQCVAALRGLNVDDPHFVTQARPPAQPINQPVQRRRFRLFG